jgi:protein-disulfide isomerase
MIQPAGGNDAAAAAPAAPVQINVDGAPFLGGENATVTLVEYSDYTCGYCIRFHNTLHEIHEHYGDRVRIVFKQFPRGNPDLAIAALAAHNQGKFWEMSDLIFANRPNGRDGIEAFGQQLGLDMDRFRRDLDDPATRERAMAERQEGAGFGVRGTPTWFLNGVQHVGAMDAARIRQLIDAQLAN